MSKIRKVLFLAHPEMDYLAYMMYDGLYKVLGKDNLDIYPFVRHYQCGIDDWYVLDDGKKGFTGPPGHVSKHATPEKSFEELANNIDSYDIIYLSSGRTYVRKAIDQFIEKCGRNNLPPLVFSEGEDHQSLHTIKEIKNRYNPVVCFKRELLQSELDNNPNLHPLYPLPFSAVTDNAPPNNPNKDIDVFVLFGNTYNIRERIVRTILSSELSKKYKLHVAIDHFSDGSDRSSMPTLMPYTIYLDLMSRSKINIMARGHGYDTVRRFEVPLFSGLVMSDRIPIITPDPFIDNIHIVYFDDNLNGFIGQIEYYLNNPGERERIGKVGREHCKKYHTTDARARYFLNKIEQHI